MMELESGTKLHNSSVDFFSLSTPLSVVLSRFEEKGKISKIGDIWIPKGYASQDCFINFFILGVEKLFQEGDKILRVEVGGGMSRFISWRLYIKSNQGLKWQLKSANEQSYVIQVFNLFSPMVEGRHNDFVHEMY